MVTGVTDKSFQKCYVWVIRVCDGGGSGGVGINDGVTLAKIDSNPHKTRPPFLQPFYIETKFWLKTSKCSLAAATAACPDDFISILETFIGKL